MNQQPTTLVAIPDQTNTAGLIGLIFSVLGWFTCGLLCIPGALFSLLGLFSAKPKALAIAGLVIGFPGTLFFAFFGMGLLLSVLGIGATAATVATTAPVAVSAPRDANADPSHDSTAVNEPEPPATEVTAETIFIDSGADTTAERVTAEASTLDEDRASKDGHDTAETRTPQQIMADAQREFEQQRIAELKGQAEQLEKQLTGPMREWSDASGKHKRQGRLARVDSGEVTLQLESGQNVTLRFDQLSKVDRDWVAGRAGQWKESQEQLTATLAELQQMLAGDNE